MNNQLTRQGEGQFEASAESKDYLLVVLSIGLGLIERQPQYFIVERGTLSERPLIDIQVPVFRVRQDDEFWQRSVPNI